MEMHGLQAKVVVAVAIGRLPMTWSPVLSGERMVWGNRAGKCKGGRAVEGREASEERRADGKLLKYLQTARCLPLFANLNNSSFYSRAVNASAPKVLTFYRD